MSVLPLVIDLDGTLIRSDMLAESALRMLRAAPFDILKIPAWLLRGKAVLKRHLALQTDFDPRFLPYNRDLLDWLKQQRALGRKLILCTASDLSIATTISQHLGVFDDVMASDGTTNLAGSHKAQALEQRFGRAGFDYAGNAPADLPVWQRARRAIVVNASAALATQVSACCEIEQVFPTLTLNGAVWRRALRIHQWPKNLLLFVPMLAAHHIANPGMWSALILAFVSFSLCASSVYIANDLLDLDSDRQHPRKCNRPFASGAIQIWMGGAASLGLILLSLLLAHQVGGAFLPWLGFYFSVTCAYSCWLKRLMLVDCLTLAVLYTLRIVSGAAAAGTVLSFWLLAFAIFIFLSLAFVKRYVELQVQALNGVEKAPGRGYFVADAPIVQMLGINAGYAAVLVLALYLNSDTVIHLYRSPEVVWGAVPVMLFWVSWIWIQAHRGKVHDDPLIFAITDKTSLLVGVLFVVILTIGAVGWPW
ncbi:MAG: UbiA family prenyltransferase [Azospirillaceae bacterium]|nr:UbiA family prenyltransferase [Azospirillaceae bacterium]